MSIDKMTRKDFFASLGSIVAGSTALAAFPWLTACTPEQDRLIKGETARLGIIGTGSRGRFHLANLLLDSSARITALATISRPIWRKPPPSPPRPGSIRITANSWKIRKWTGSSSARPCTCTPG